MPSFGIQIHGLCQLHILPQQLHIFRNYALQPRASHGGHRPREAGAKAAAGWHCTTAYNAIL